HVALKVVTRQLAATDPQKALSLLSELPLGPHRREALGGIAARWANSDTEGALAWMDSLPPMDKEAALKASLWGLGNHSPERAARMLEAAPPSPQLVEAYTGLTEQWARMDPHAARSWIHGLERGPARSRAVNGFLRALKLEDPAQAAALVVEESVTFKDFSEIGHIASNWIRKDEGAALDWLGQWETDDRTRDETVSQMVRNWATHNVTDAAQYAIGLENDQRREQAIDALVGGWASQDPGEAKDWILSEIEEGPLRQESINTAIRHIVHEDFATALDFYEEATTSLDPEETAQAYGHSMSQIAASWARHDPESAGQWTLQQPDSPEREEAIGSIMGNWVQFDPVSASKFITELPVGTGRDSAVSTLIGQIQQTDPEAAFQWADPHQQ
ncbi:MAG: hypothetical protein AAF514_20260, partial [Verrucomicrobiota bacterium]